MPFTFTNIQVDASGLGATYVRANAVSSGNYVPTTGDTLDMTPLAIAAGVDLSPTDVFLESSGGGGNQYAPILGTLFNNWKLRAYTAAGSEFSAAAYPADTIRINVVFNKGL